MEARVLCRTPGGRLQVSVAANFLARAGGLLFRPPLEQDEALLIAPCSSIHTFAMRYPIDVVFLDRRARILRVCPQVRAGRLRFAWGAAAVLELRAGQAARHGLTRGVMLDWLGPAPAVPAPRFSIEATLVGGPNLNPNLEGRAAPVVVRVFELKQTAAFEAADFTALFERSQQTLQSDLVTQEEFILRPGEIRYYERKGGPYVAALGLVAAFRTLEKDAWRVVVHVAPDAHNLLLIGLDDHQIQVSPLSNR
jgi:type VI secretion system VasD/TssJ family lipoprotein